MGAWGVIALIGGALALATIGQILRRRTFGFEMLVVAAGAAAGGFVVSAHVGEAGSWGWELDGLAVFPAVIGGIAGAMPIEFVTNAIAPHRRTPHEPDGL